MTIAHDRLAGAIRDFDNACGDPDCGVHIDEALAQEDGYERIAAGLWARGVRVPDLTILSAERRTEIGQLVKRQLEFWSSEDEMNRAFDIAEQLDQAEGTWGTLPPFEPAELRDLCRAVFAARDLWAALEPEE